MWIKRLIIYLLIVVLLAVLGAILYSVLAAKKYFDGLDYQYRLRECSSQELLPDLERVYDINFPEGIKEIRTAKTPGSWDSETSGFIVKFTAEPAIVNKFLRSFSRGIRFEPYRSEFDRRESFGPPQYILRWFTEPIQQGRDGRYHRGDINIYIDTTDERHFVVYMHGFL